MKRLLSHIIDIINETVELKREADQLVEKSKNL